MKKIGIGVLIVVVLVVGVFIGMNYVENSKEESERDLYYDVLDLEKDMQGIVGSMENDMKSDAYDLLFGDGKDKYPEKIEKFQKKVHKLENPKHLEKEVKGYKDSLISATDELREVFIDLTKYEGLVGLSKLDLEKEKLFESFEYYELPN